MKFGVIGAGFIASRFTGVLHGVDGIEIAAVADVNLSRAQALAEKYGIPQVYADGRELLENKEIDAVYIGLINVLHVPMVMAAIEAGKAVLCEKPLTMSREECQKLVDFARSRNCLLMEGMWTKALPAYLKAKKLMADGEIGDVHFVQADFCENNVFNPSSRLFSKALGGGATFDVGVYAIEFAIGLLGKPEAIDGSAVIGETEVDVTSCVCLSFPNGALAVCNSAINVFTKPDAFIYGTKGYIKLENFYMAQTCEVYTQDHKLVKRYEYPHEDGFIYEIQHFRDLFNAGKLESDLITLNDSLLTSEVYDVCLKKWGLR